MPWKLLALSILMLYVFNKEIASERLIFICLFNFFNLLAAVVSGL